MKKLKTITLMALVLAGGLASCKKDSNQVPDGGKGQMTNSAQLFFGDNKTVNLESNDDVKATYADNKLTINFTQNGTDVALQIPNYDINASSGDYNNSNISMTVKHSNQSYISTSVFIPVIVGNPPHPVFITDKSIKISTSNLKVDDNTTDIGLLIVSGSEITTVPVSNGQGPSYQSLAFVQGDGGKPNMINLRIKH